VPSTKPGQALHPTRVVSDSPIEATPIEFCHIEGVSAETASGSGDGEELIENGSRSRISSEEEVVVLGQ
jgi:hypothetical protein